MASNVQKALAECPDANDVKLDAAFAIWLAPWPFPDEVKTQYAEVLYRRIFQIVKKAALPVGNLKFTQPELAIAINAHNRATGRGGQVGWFAVNYENPGWGGFAMSISDDVIQIRFGDQKLSDLARVIDTVASPITDALLENDLEQPIQIKNRSSTVEYRFDHKIELKKHRINSGDVCNYQIMADAFHLNPQPGKTADLSVQQAVPSIGIESFIRVDYSQHGLLKLRGNAYNARFGLEAPWNVTQKLLAVETHLRMEEEFGLRYPEAIQWDVAMLDFYRDIVLTRFIRNLLSYAEYEYA